MQPTGQIRKPTKTMAVWPTVVLQFPMKTCSRTLKEKASNNPNLDENLAGTFAGCTINRKSGQLSGTIRN